MEYELVSRKGNKVVLLGEWRPSEIRIWKEVIDSDDIYEHDFILLDPNREIQSFLDGSTVDIKLFDDWFRQRYGLNSSARWAVLKMGDELIVSGTQRPNAKELKQMLDKSGLKSKVRQVRDFLRENPDHIDAMTDLLVEVRRRALRLVPLMPTDTTEDLDTEADLRTWAVMASELDKVFKGPWLGIDILFFRPDRQQPERFSKLMKDCFRKHIPKVESALRLEPTNETLWNIWAWMAQNMADYKWETFINSIDTLNFSRLHLYSPSTEVCCWLVEQARAKGQWETVIKYAGMAKKYYGPKILSPSLAMWMPGRGSGLIGGDTERIKGYDMKSSYAPHLEALLRLGRIEEANDLYDIMIHESSYDPSESRGRGGIVAKIARSIGMDEIASVWEQGRLISREPRLKNFMRRHFYVYAENHESEFYKQFGDLLKQLVPRVDIELLPESRPESIIKLGWEKTDRPRWALIAGDWDGRVLIQDSKIPSLVEMQAIYDRFIENETETCKKYLATHKGLPGLKLELVHEIIQENNFSFINRNKAPVDDTQDETLWKDVTRYLKEVLTDYRETLINMTHNTWTSEVSTQSLLLKSISKSMLANIEQLIQKKPSSDDLWNQWLYWQAVEGEERSVLPIINNIKLSPITRVGSIPPSFVVDNYYNDCKKSGDWSKVIELLKTAWDRESLKITDNYADPFRDQPPDFPRLNKTTIGDWLGIYLIEAYLQDNKPREADEIFNAVIDCGGNFSNIADIIRLAMEKGHEKLARKWEKTGANTGGTP
jgi:hypothetical protein